MTMRCEQSLPLIPAYLDGELGEERAGPLRRHLLDCQPCRTATQGERALKRWFQAEPPMQVPPGFAARVARRAFAGDLGRELAPESAAESSNGRLLIFVLRATAAAAVLLIGLAGMLRSVQLPEGRDLRAEDQAPPTLEELLSDLEQLNAPREAPAAPAEDRR